MNSKPSITVFDVARLAEVSIATVSRVLNDAPNVNAAMKARVLQAANTLGYATNSAGKALRKRRTQTIATIVPKLDNAIFSEATNSIQEVLMEQDYVGYVQTVGFDNSDLYGYARHFIDRGAEGLIVFGRIDDEKLIEFAKSSQFPIVQAYSYLPDNPLPSVGIDNYSATRQLLQLMLQLGHTKIAMICRPLAGNDRQQSRAASFTERMQEQGLTPVLQYVGPNQTLPDGSAGLRALMAEHPETTAVLCNSESIAFGVLAECRKLGLRVPQDLSVCGFDDVSFAPLLDPPLTTLSIPVADIGRQAALSLLANIESGQKIHSTVFDTSLIVRASTDRPRQQERATARV